MAVSCWCDIKILIIISVAVLISSEMGFNKLYSKFTVLMTSARQGEIVCTYQTQIYTELLALEGKGVGKLLDKKEVPVAALVVMACDRIDCLERTITSILKYQDSVAVKYPLFVSQDGRRRDVKNKALSYKQLIYMQHLDFEPVDIQGPEGAISDYMKTRHYKWTLDQLFYKYNFSRVIILEDDMEIAHDFFDYFEVAAALLDEDETIMAVSSCNDKGWKQFVPDQFGLYHGSKFSTGLGWMLTKSIWGELSPMWPKTRWDDWLSLKENHKGRHFIRPDICRTYKFREPCS